MLIQHANLGNGNLLSKKLLTGSGAPKPLRVRASEVRKWAIKQQATSHGLMEAKYSESAKAFVHTVRAIADAGLFNQLVESLTVILTDLAVEGFEAEHRGGDSSPSD